MLNTQPKRSVTEAMQRSAALATHPDALKLRALPHARKVSIIRKGGLGIKGTVANIEHHAPGVKAMVFALAPVVLKMGYGKWKQGHNVHVFETKDGRIFDIVPLKRDSQYVGLELRSRPTRGNRITMAQLVDMDDDFDDFVATMRTVLRAPRTDCYVLGGTACNE